MRCLLVASPEPSSSPSKFTSTDSCKRPNERRQCRDRNAATPSQPSPEQPQPTPRPRNVVTTGLSTHFRPLSPSHPIPFKNKNARALRFARNGVTVPSWSATSRFFHHPRCFALAHLELEHGHHLLPVPQTGVYNASGRLNPMHSVQDGCNKAPRLRVHRRGEVSVSSLYTLHPSSDPQGA